jgi:hypothetical protein
LQMFYLDVTKVDQVLYGVAGGCRCCWGAAAGQPSWVSPRGAWDGCRARVPTTDVNVGAGAGCGTRGVGWYADAGSSSAGVKATSEHDDVPSGRPCVRRPVHQALQGFVGGRRRWTARLQNVALCSMLDPVSSLAIWCS